MKPDSSPSPSPSPSRPKFLPPSDGFILKEGFFLFVGVATAAALLLAAIGNRKVEPPPTPALSLPILTTPGVGGGRIDLWKSSPSPDHPGGCFDSFPTVFYPGPGKSGPDARPVPGCWKVVQTPDGPMVHLVFFDVTVAGVPVGNFKPPAQI